MSPAPIGGNTKVQEGPVRGLVDLAVIVEGQDRDDEQIAERFVSLMTR
jgi:hypothetical protein